MEGTLTPAAGGKKIRKATTPEIIAIHGLLRDHLVKTPEGLFAYADDWSDAKIAATVATDGSLSANAVSRVRLETFGGLKPTNPNQNLQAEIADLRQQVERLESVLNGLSHRVAVLEPPPALGLGETAAAA